LAKPAGKVMCLETYFFAESTKSPLQYYLYTVFAWRECVGMLKNRLARVFVPEL
jgi:hypothetical protein